MVSDDLMMSTVGVVGCDSSGDTSTLDFSIGGADSLPSDTCAVELDTAVESCSVPDFGMDTTVGSSTSGDTVQDIVGSEVDQSAFSVPVHDTTPLIAQRGGMVSLESVIGERIAGDVRQLATSQSPDDQLWFRGEQLDATSYRCYCPESFLDHLLESSEIREGSYRASEGVLIWGVGTIRRLVREIVGTLTTMFPHKDFEVGFVERVTQHPIRPVLLSSISEPSPDSQFGSDEPFGAQSRRLESYESCQLDVGISNRLWPT